MKATEINPDDELHKEIEKLRQKLGVEGLLRALERLHTVPASHQDVVPRKRRNRAVRIKIWSRYDDNMISSWTDSLWLTKRKNGSFSVKPKKHCAGGETWQFDSVCGMRTPEQFVDEVLKSWEDLGCYFGRDEVVDLLPKVAELDVDFAMAVMRYLDKE